MSKAILITGVNGFVGRHLAIELINHNYTVIGVGGSGGGSAPDGLGNYMQLDLTSSAAAEQIDFKNIDGVIHLAGLAAVGPSFDNPMLYVTTNIGIEAALFEAAQGQNAHPKFIIVSSGSLYDPRTNLPITEQSDVLPNSPYAVSKLGQEQMAQYYATRGFEIVIARPFNHIGPGQNPGFIVPDLAQQIVAVKNGQAGEVKVGNLDAKRDYTDVRDIVAAYRLLIERGKSGEMYNICSGGALSGHEILAQLVSAGGIDPTIIQDPSKMRPSDTLEIYGSHDRLTQDTGWQPQISITQTIRDVLADWQSR